MNWGKMLLIGFCVALMLATAVQAKVYEISRDNNAKTYTVSQKIPVTKSQVYNVPHDGPTQWLHDARERRNWRNMREFDFRNKEAEKDRIKRKKSRNWWITVGTQHDDVYWGENARKLVDGELDHVDKSPRRRTVTSKHALAHGFY